MRFDKLSVLLCISLWGIVGTAVAQTQTQAQQGPVRPICANCHEDKWNSIDLTGHGARTDANGSMFSGRRLGLRVVKFRRSP